MGGESSDVGAHVARLFCTRKEIPSDVGAESVDNMWSAKLLVTSPNNDRHPSASDKEK